MNHPVAAQDKQGHDKHWLVRARTIRWLWIGGCAVLALITLADLVIHPHPYFGIDGTFGFNSWYGLLTCAAMVFFAKGLGFLLKRPDTYYEPAADDETGDENQGGGA